MPSPTQETPRPQNEIRFGPIVISWEQPGIYPIAVDHERLNGEAAFVTTCAITFRRIGTELKPTVPAGFRFDGASIPRLFWIVPGFSPTGLHLWAALIHDFLCEEAKAGRFDRVIADAIFAAILEHSLPGWRGHTMELAVNLYRRGRRVRGC